MKIELQEQLDTDFDWFCVDIVGQIGHFTTAGFKQLPQSVARSAEDLKLVREFFELKLANRGTHRIDEVVLGEATNFEDRGERYFRSFVAMCNKGLYSFDIAPHVKPNLCYFRVASPTNPLLLTDLPQKYKE